ncbi:transposase [bacterium AH-315-K03]|nr:transposase [bacterium AH-315-K03]
MFNEIRSGQSLPKYLSSDNDPIFLFHRWKANLSVLDIEEIKSVPHVPTSHPFVERVIGTTRREFLDQTLFFNNRGLKKKLDEFQQYYNETRGHASLGSNTQNSAADGSIVCKNGKLPVDYGWKSYCNGLYKFPVVA